MAVSAFARPADGYATIIRQAKADLRAAANEQTGVIVSMGRTRFMKRDS